MKGKELYDFFLELSGLEQSQIEPILNRLLKQLNLDINHLTEDDIRNVIMLYLDELNADFSEEESIQDLSVETPKA